MSAYLGFNFFIGVFGRLTAAKYQHPRSKIAAARKDSPSLKTTVPEKIAHAMRLQAGDSMEWIWTQEGFLSYCKVVKVSSETKE